MLNPRSIVWYTSTYMIFVKIWLVLTAEVCTSFTVSCAYCWWMDIKKACNFIC